MLSSFSLVSSSKYRKSIRKHALSRTAFMAPRGRVGEVNAESVALQRLVFADIRPRGSAAARNVAHFVAVLLNDEFDVGGEFATAHATTTATSDATSAVSLLPPEARATRDEARPALQRAFHFILDLRIVVQERKLRPAAIEVLFDLSNGGARRGFHVDQLVAARATQKVVAPGQKNCNTCGIINQLYLRGLLAVIVTLSSPRDRISIL